MSYISLKHHSPLSVYTHLATPTPIDKTIGNNCNNLPLQVPNHIVDSSPSHSVCKVYTAFWMASSKFWWWLQMTRQGYEVLWALASHSGG